MKKHYRIREYSPLWWITRVGLAVAMITLLGVLNSWELGLL